MLQPTGVTVIVLSRTLTQSGFKSLTSFIIIRTVNNVQNYCKNKEEAQT